MLPTFAGAAEFRKKNEKRAFHFHGRVSLFNTGINSIARLQSRDVELCFQHVAATQKWCSCEIPGTQYK